MAKSHLTYKQALAYIYSFTDYEKKSAYRVHSPACRELVARIEATDRSSEDREPLDAKVCPVN